MVQQIQTCEVVDILCAFAFSVLAWAAIYVFEALYQVLVRAYEDEREWRERNGYR